MTVFMLSPLQRVTKLNLEIHRPRADRPVKSSTIVKSNDPWLCSGDFFFFKFQFILSPTEGCTRGQQRGREGAPAMVFPTAPSSVASSLWFLGDLCSSRSRCHNSSAVLMFLTIGFGGANLSRGLQGCWLWRTLHGHTRLWQKVRVLHVCAVLWRQAV